MADAPVADRDAAAPSPQDALEQARKDLEGQLKQAIALGGQEVRDSILIDMYFEVRRLCAFVDRVAEQMQRTPGLGRFLGG